MLDLFFAAAWQGARRRARPGRRPAGPVRARRPLHRPRSRRRRGAEPRVAGTAVAVRGQPATGSSASPASSSSPSRWPWASPSWWPAASARCSTSATACPPWSTSDRRSRASRPRDPAEGPDGLVQRVLQLAAGRLPRGRAAAGLRRAAGHPAAHPHPAGAGPGRGGAGRGGRGGSAADDPAARRAAHLRRRQGPDPRRRPGAGVGAARRGGVAARDSHRRPSSPRPPRTTSGSGWSGRVVDWLRAGYPTGLPDRDFVPLIALLRRRLTDEEVRDVARRLALAGVLPDRTRRHRDRHRRGDHGAALRGRHRPRAGLPRRARLAGRLHRLSARTVGSRPARHAAGESTQLTR